MSISSRRPPMARLQARRTASRSSGCTSSRYWGTSMRWGNWLVQSSRDLWKDWMVTPLLRSSHSHTASPVAHSASSSRRLASTTDSPACASRRAGGVHAAPGDPARRSGERRAALGHTVGQQGVLPCVRQAGETGIGGMLTHRLGGASPVPPPKNGRREHSTLGASVSRAVARQPRQQRQEISAFRPMAQGQGTGAWVQDRAAACAGQRRGDRGPFDFERSRIRQARGPLPGGASLCSPLSRRRAAARASSRTTRAWWGLGSGCARRLGLLWRPGLASRSGRDRAW